VGWLKRKDLFRFFLFPSLPSTVFIFNDEGGRRTGNQVYGVAWREPETVVEIPIKLRGAREDVVGLYHFTIDRGDYETEEDVVVLGGLRAFTNASVNEVPVGGRFSVLRPFLAYFMIPWFAISYVILMLISGGVLTGGFAYFLLGVSLFAVLYPLIMLNVYTSARPVRYVELLPIGHVTGRNVIELDGKLITVEGEGAPVYTPSPNQVGMALFMDRLEVGPVVLKTGEAPLVTRAGVKFIEAEMWKRKATDFAKAAREGGILSTPHQYLAALDRMNGSRLRRLALPLALIVLTVVVAVLIFLLLQPQVITAPPNATAVHNATASVTTQPAIKVF
jgi:hypothetical protein